MPLPTRQVEGLAFTARHEKSFDIEVNYAEGAMAHSATLRNDTRTHRRKLGSNPAEFFIDLFRGHIEPEGRRRRPWYRTGYGEP